MPNRKILKISDPADANVNIKVETECVVLVTLTARGHSPLPIQDALGSNGADRRLANGDYVLRASGDHQLPGKTVKATVTGKVSGSRTAQATVTDFGEVVLRLGFAMLDGVVS